MHLRMTFGHVSGSAERAVWCAINGIWLLSMKALLASERLSAHSAASTICANCVALHPEVDMSSLVQDLGMCHAVRKSAQGRYVSARVCYVLPPRPACTGCGCGFGVADHQVARLACQKTKKQMVGNRSRASTCLRASLTRIREEVVYIFQSRWNRNDS